MNRVVIAALLTSAALEPAFAQQGTIYSCIDESGRRYYTNVKSDTDGRKCTVVQKEISVVPAQPAPAAASRRNGPAGGTRVDPSTQRNRDEARRRILTDELSAAESQLAAARQKLAEQEGIREGGERNYQRVLDRLKPYQEEVARQEQNVADLKREMSALR